jgi:hypothetical protein
MGGQTANEDVLQPLGSWDAVLDSPAPADHLVQLYTDDRTLVPTVSRYIERGVRDGNGIIAVATAAHWGDIAARLGERGIDVAAARDRGQLAVFDAHETLARLTVHGMPDRTAMREILLPAAGAIRRAGHDAIRAFGEMVDILNRRANLAAAIRLEELWNELLAEQRISLLCAYAVDPFDREQYAETLPRIGGVHSHLMPVDDGDRLERAIDRAFMDVFGIYGDTRLLRELFVRDLRGHTAMPAAQAALFALRELDERLADAVLTRAASHYHGV